MPHTFILHDLAGLASFHQTFTIEAIGKARSMGLGGCSCQVVRNLRGLDRQDSLGTSRAAR
jgi:hypothetical protein